MRGMAELFSKIDVIVVPSSSAAQLIITNLTGHPAVIIPNAIRGQDAPKPPAIDTDDDDSIDGTRHPIKNYFPWYPFSHCKGPALAPSSPLSTIVTVLK